MKKLLPIVALLFITFSFSSCDEVEDAVKELDCVSLATQYNELIDTPEEEMDCDYYAEVISVLKEGKDCSSFQEMAAEQDMTIDEMIAILEALTAIGC